MKTSLLFPLIAGLAFSSANAATVTSDTSAPDSSWLSIAAGTSNIRWQYTTSTNASSHRDVGQLFKVGSENILFESLTLQVGFADQDSTVIGNGAPNGAFSISLYEFAGKDSVSPLGAALYTEQATLPGSFTQGLYVTISLAAPYELQAGHYYGVVLAFDDPVANQYINWVSASSGSYGDGSIRRYENQTANDPTQSWVASNGHLHLYIGATAIPEPHHYALLAIGAVFLVWRKRRAVA